MSFLSSIVSSVFPFGGLPGGRRPEGKPPKGVVSILGQVPDIPFPKVLHELTLNDYPVKGSFFPTPFAVFEGQI